MTSEGGTRKNEGKVTGRQTLGFTKGKLFSQLELSQSRMGPWGDRDYLILEDLTVEAGGLLLKDNIEGILALLGAGQGGFKGPFILRVQDSR